MRDKLIELIRNILPIHLQHWPEIIANDLIAHGVTFAEDNNVPDKKPGPGVIRSITATECDGYTQVLIDFYWDGCSYPITSKVSHAKIVGKGYEKKRRWIPVSERLPEIFTHVLVQIPGESPFATVHEGWRNPYGGWNADGFTREFDEVTHWMPLPKAPKEGE